MTTFKYIAKAIRVDEGPEPVERELRQLGADGWESVAVVGTGAWPIFVFKMIWICA